MPAKKQKFSVEPRIRLNHGRGFAFGPGKAELLEYIDQTGSISEAAKAMEMSYMRAWTLVKSMDRSFAEPLVLKTRGGSERGGATLSATGREVLGLYREMEAASRKAMLEISTRLQRLLEKNSCRVFNGRAKIGCSGRTFCTRPGIREMRRKRMFPR